MSSLTDPATGAQEADTPPQHQPPPRIRRWIALLDQVERCISSPNAAHPETQELVASALDTLFAFEHGLTPAERRQAREEAWRRDRGADSLPGEDKRMEWEHCRCRACAIAAGLGRPSVNPDAQRYLRLVRRASDDPETPFVGDLI
jgi:transposase InsO family protein